MFCSYMNQPIGWKPLVQTTARYTVKGLNVAQPKAAST